MRIKHISTLFASCVLVATLSACGDNTPSRVEVMTELTDKQIIPSYQSFTRAANESATAVEHFCKTPNDKSGVINKVAEARLAWRSTQTFWAGPVMTRRSQSFIDYQPKPDDIQAILNKSEFSNLDTDTIRRIGSDERGFGAIDYLLSNSADSDSRRCQYAASAARVIADEAVNIEREWTTAGDKPAYRDTFTGKSNDDVAMHIDTLVNDNIYVVNGMSDQELGRALGTARKKADPTVIVEGSTGDGVKLMRARLNGVKASMVGNDEQQGLSPLLGKDLANRLRDSIEAADQALLAIDGSLLAALNNDRDDVTAAKAKLEEVRRIIATEVVSRLGVTVGFSDSDGDSAA